MKKILIIAATFLLLAGCKEEMDFDYHTIAPIDVVEAYLTQDGLNIAVTQTNNMNDTIQTKVGDAVIILTDESGNTIDHLSAPAVGQEYTLKVTTGGKTYISSSYMNRATTIESATFLWESIMGRDHLYCKILINDIPGEDNYYCLRMFRNGTLYKWSVFNDKGYKDGVIERSITCMTRETYEDNEPEKQDIILHDMDKIRFELQTIDRKAYDYLYSLSLSKRQSYNPLTNFSNGCLGFFIAGGTHTLETVYHYTE